MSEAFEGFIVDCNYLKVLDEDEHLTTIEEIFNIFKEDFSVNSRQRMCLVELGDEEFEIALNDLFFSLLLITSRIHSEENITKEHFVFNVTNPKSTLNTYFDKVIEELSNRVDTKTLTQKIGYTIELIAKYTWEINVFCGNTVNIIDIIELLTENPRVKEILDFTVNENMQYKEISDIITKMNDELVSIIKNPESPDTYLKNMIGTISIGQFQQVFTNIGLKPDLNDNIIPKPINTSFLRGLRNSTDFFINAVGARKALITNSNEVSKAGYLSRKLILLLIIIQLAEDVEDCGPRTLLPIIVKNEKIAERYLNRYYKLKESEKKFTLITRYNYKELVGKTIFAASPITCNLAPEHKMCKTCYGRMSKLNPFHKGISNMLKMTEQILQKMLSSKHLLKVVSSMIELPKQLEDLLEVDKNILISKKPFKLQISDTYYDETYNKELITELILLDKNEEEIEKIQIEDNEIYLTDEMLEKLDENLILDINKEENVFKLEIQNNGLSIPLKRTVSLIESSKEMNKRLTTSELVMDLLDLLNESDIVLSAVGIEMIVRELARDLNDNQLKTFAENNINFLRVTDAIVNSPSASISLSFQEYNRLLEGILFNKNAESCLDVFY
ncbi:MAG: hypothetical protein [Bacteriophage sp.]|nr:MAG: hypothetical protein [Bacteriophage sp.]